MSSITVTDMPMNIQQWWLETKLAASKYQSERPELKLEVVPPKKTKSGIWLSAYIKEIIT